MELKTRDEAAEVVANLIGDALEAEVQRKGKAVLLSSGGTTPKYTLVELSKRTLDWSRVSVGLVDERNVDRQDDASNAGLLEEHLLQNEASDAQFFPMINHRGHAAELARLCDRTYVDLMPPTFALLGMGLDGHTASWFPGASNLARALEPTDETVVAIDAQGCPVAGEVTDRLTLTRSALSSAMHAALLIFGENKKQTLFEALSKPIQEAPIRAVAEDFGEKLTIAWAP